MMKLNSITQICVTKYAHVCRQIIATFATALLSITAGIIFGFSSVLLPQMKDDKSFPYDKNYASWIVSISPLAMAIACGFTGTLSDKFGRKLSLIALIIPVSIGWAIIGFSNNNISILFGRFITGYCSGAIIPSTMVYVGELTDPKYRSVALYTLSTCLFLGMLTSHVVGKYVYWKISCFLFIIPNLFSFLLLLMFKESPLWLFNKNRIAEGKESFKLFRGNAESSKKELEDILSKINEKTEETSFRDTVNTIFSKPFMMSLSCILLLFVAAQWCGLNTISFYAQDIFEKTFDRDVDVYLLIIATDCIRTVAAVFLCFFAKVMPRRKTFIACCFSITLALVILIIYLYLSPKGLAWLAITCMIIYTSIASILTCISWSFISEIFPAKMRGFGSAISSFISFTLLFIAVKATPEILTSFGVIVMYGCFAVAAFFTGIFMIFLLPETNGKSLQEIEDDLYRGKKAVNTSSEPEIVTKF